MSTQCRILILLLWVTVTLEAGEFPVNDRTASNQCNPAIATYSDSSFVVVWSSYYSSSGRSNDVMARRFDPNGQAVTEEFRVNTNRNGNQTYPSVATDALGHTLVVWQGPSAAEDEDIFARAFDVNGVPLTEEILVNTQTQRGQRYPSVTSNGTGTFAVVWESEQIEAGDPRTAIGAQLLDGFASPIGPELIIDPNTWDCRYPDVAMDAAGNLVVTWLRDRSSNVVVARRFDPNGLAVTEAFEVSIETISSITHPAVAMSATGDSIIAWDGDPNAADRDKIHVRLLDPNGLPKAEPFVVSPEGQAPHQWPQIAADRSGRFVVVWQSESETPDHATDILARRCDRSGEPLEEPFRLNDCAADKQRYPVVATNPDGSCVALWESDQQPGSDYDIYARIEPALPTADYNADGTVDFVDFRILGVSWKMSNDVAIGDFAYDVPDLQMLCSQWLQ